MKKVYLHSWIFRDLIVGYLDAAQTLEVRGLFHENIAAAAQKSCHVEGLNKKNVCHSMQLGLGRGLSCVLKWRKNKVSVFHRLMFVWESFD